MFYWTSSWSVMRTGKFYEPKMICWWMNVEIFVFMYFISLSSHFSILFSLFTCSMTMWERCDSVQLIVPPVWLKMYRFFWAFTALLFSCFLQNTINPAYTPCFSSGNNHNLQTRNIHLKMGSYLNPDQSLSWLKHVPPVSMFCRSTIAASRLSLVGLKKYRQVSTVFPAAEWCVVQPGAARCWPGAVESTLPITDQLTFPSGDGGD